MTEASYATLRPGVVARTVEAVPGREMHVDLDDDGRVLGVEVAGGGAWQDALVALAVAGRLRVA